MARPLRFFFLLFFFSIAIAHAQSRIDCNVLQSRILKEPVHYCVLLPPGYDAAAGKRPARQYPVLYFLHGLGDSEQSLFKSGGWNVIEDLRQQHKITDFLIAAPEGRASFYINSADGKTRYSDFFLTEFIPYMEGKYSIRRTRAARGITGVSMGGYGALRFAFAHPELFSSVSAESPALLTPEALQSPGMGRQLGGMLGEVFGNPINRTHWKQNDPFTLAKLNRVRLKSMAIYFNCGQDDEYGFAASSEALHRQLQDEGIRHEYHSYPGNHSATYFLAHLGEVMEFHSRMFQRSK
jgi:S-formylglutathione hydrolase FrmB